MEREHTTTERGGRSPEREDRLLGNLLALMENQAALYGDLKKALSEEKLRIVSLDLQGLAATGRLKETLVTKIQSLEKDRIKVMRGLAEISSITFQDLTVGNLIARSRGYTQKRILQSRETLLKLAEQIRQMNRLNKMLVRHTLELIAGSYSFLSQLAAPDSVYQSSGGLRPRHQNGKFISNTI